MHIISRTIIEDFCRRNAHYAERCYAWFSLVETLDWRKPKDMVDSFGDKAVDILGKWKNKNTDRVVFDLGGNEVRIIARYVFHPKLKRCRLYLKWIGNHAEYDKLCDNNLQYTVEKR
ncbi:type II toxin-antitoxin system HigB family toxin [Bacteroidales bacterium AH-315-N07]|nr:type II toxin-antitoxin system HigB family toxin [Bacteroidales bacterium AH-315-N07]